MLQCLLACVRLEGHCEKTNCWSELYNSHVSHSLQWNYLQLIGLIEMKFLWSFYTIRCTYTDENCLLINYESQEDWRLHHSSLWYILGLCWRLYCGYIWSFDKVLISIQLTIDNFILFHIVDDFLTIEYFGIMVLKYVYTVIEQICYVHYSSSIYIPSKLLLFYVFSLCQMMIM